VPNAHLKKVYYKDVLSASDAPDAYTVVFQHEDDRYAMALEHLWRSFEVMPRHVYSVGDFMKARPQPSAARSAAGPYTFKRMENRPKRVKVLSRFENYWGDNTRDHQDRYSLFYHQERRSGPCRRSRRVTSTAYNLQPVCSGRRQTDSEKFHARLSKDQILSQRAYRYIGYNMRQPPVQRPASADRQWRHLMDLDARQRNHSREPGRSHDRAHSGRTESAQLDQKQ
jgi:ABC-type transport system substrate-binding protein